jgi:hypothetical protein
MAKVKLTIKNGEVRESVTFEIDRVTTLQMIKLKNEVGAIMKELKGNGELGSFVQTLFNGDAMPDLTTDDAKAQALESLKDERFMTGLASAFDKLIETLPDRAFNLLSILSGIDAETLEKTYFDELFDVYDAIMEENDIKKIVDRVKQSFFATKDQWGNLIRNMFNKQNK